MTTIQSQNKYAYNNGDVSLFTPILPMWNPSISVNGVEDQSLQQQPIADMAGFTYYGTIWLVVLAVLCQNQKNRE